MRLIFALLAAFLIITSVAAQPSLDGHEINLSIQSEEPIEVGGTFTIRADIAMPGDYDSLLLEPLDAQSAPYLITSIRPVDGSTFDVVARAIRSGEHELEFGAELRLRGSDSAIPARPSRLTMTINAPEGDLEPSIAPLTAARSLPFDYTLRNVIYTVSAIVGIALFALLMWLLWKWLNLRVLAPKPERVVPPIEEALTTVRRLRALDVFHEQGANAHYTALSNVIRRYLEKQFDRSALEMTEDEVVDLLRGELRNVAGIDSLPTVLQRSSLAKFANQELTEDLAAQDCEATESFLITEERRLAALEKQRAQNRTPGERAA